jgi:hypothetical protein
MGLSYTNYQSVFSGADATADAESGSLNSAGYSSARVCFVVSGLVDAGGINATLGVQGSMDGTNWSATIGVATAAAASATYMSAVLDIRCYNHIRLVYLKNGATAGTYTGHVALLNN